MFKVRIFRKKYELNGLDKSERQFRAVTKMLVEQLEEGGTLCFNVVSNSMTPLIRVNDSVIVEKFVPAKLAIGEIIIFEKEPTYCTHRFILRRKKHGNYEYITKGDRYFKFDQPVPENRILGKIKAIRRKKNKIDLRRLTCRIYGILLGTIFKMQWFSFQFFKFIFSVFSNSEKVDKYYMLDK